MILLFFGLLLVTIVLLLMLVVFGFTVRALSSVLLIPHQAAALFTNESVRRNEVLKHATMNVIEERFGPSGLNGVSRDRGFTLDGIAPPDIILRAAQEGLTRLRAGERRLAIHRRCVTAIVSAGLLGALVFLGILLGTDHMSLLNIVLAVMVANALAPFSGLFLQKLLPRYTDVSELHIVGLAGTPLGAEQQAVVEGPVREHFEIRTKVGP
jgi:Domain of unknown function (DUF6391)